MTSSEISDRDIEVAAIIEAFEAARRATPQLSAAEWIERHPEFADDLREILPAYVAMEDAASRSESSAGLAAISEPAPERVGEYRIVRELGRGGMGVVYLAIHEPLQREVALKVLPSNLLLDDAFLERFQREARVAAGLDHANIVPAYAVGEAQGRHYLAMRYIDGCSLHEMLQAMQGLPAARDKDTSPTGRSSGDVASAVRAVRSMGASSVPEPEKIRATEPLRRGISPRSAAAMSLQLSRALAHAHGAGVLHRDIKPSNILIDKDGHPFIADFGLCRVDGGGDLTATQSVVGTLRYMAPEQIDGAVDERSDVYALGLVLFEMLTLRPAFDAERRARLIHDILHQSVPNVSRLRKGIPGPLEVIVGKATAKLPSERYSGAQAMARDLEAFLDGRPIEAAPPSSLYLARLFLARHRFESLVALAAVVALAMLGALYLVDLRASRELAQRQAYTGDLAAAEAALREGSIVRAQNRLTAAPERFRSWEWKQLVARADQSIARVLLQDGWLDEARFSPSGEFVAVSGERGLSIVRVDDFEVTGHVDARSVRGLAWSDDGAQLAAVHESRAVVLYGVDGRGVATEITRADGALAREGGDVQLVRVGDRYLFSGGYSMDGTQGVVWSWSPRDGRITDVARLPSRVEGLGSLDDETARVVLPDRLRRRLERPGAFAWWSVTDFGTVTLHVDGLSEALDLDLTGEAVTACCRVGPDLFIGTRQGGLLYYSLIGRRNPERLPSSGSAIYALAVSQDYVLHAGKNRLIQALDRRDPAQPFDFSGNSNEVRGLAWHPDGERFVSLSMEGLVRLWDVNALGGGQTLRGHLNDVGCVSFAPDGRRLITGSREGNVIVWDALRGEMLARFDGPSGSVQVATFLGDGDRVMAISARRQAYVWDLASGELLHHRSIEGDCPSGGVWDPVRGAVALATPRGIVHLEDDLTWRDPNPIVGAAEDGEVAPPPTLAVALEPASECILGLRLDGSILVLEPTGRTRLLTTCMGREARAFGGLVVGIPGTRTEGVAYFGNEDGGIAMVRIDSNEALGVLRANASDGAPGEVLMGATPTPDGERLLVTTRNGLVGVWSLEGEHLLDLRAHGSWGLRTVSSPSIGVAVSVSSEGSVRLWTTRTSSEAARLRADIPPLAEPERIARMRREAAVESVLDRVTEAMIRDAVRLPHPEWLQLGAILRWQPENRRAAALMALHLAAGRTSILEAPKLEQAKRDLPAEHMLQPHLDAALADLRTRLQVDALQRAWSWRSER